MAATTAWTIALAWVFMQACRLTKESARITGNQKA